MVSSRIWTNDSFSGVLTNMALPIAQQKVQQIRLEFQEISRIYGIQVKRTGLKFQREELKRRIGFERRIQMEFETAIREEQDDARREEAKESLQQAKLEISRMEDELEQNGLELMDLEGFKESDLEDNPLTNESPPRSEDGVIADLDLDDDQELEIEVAQQYNQENAE